MQTTDASNFFRTESELAKDEARKLKAQRTNDLGAPLDLPGKILSLKVRGSEAWTAESGHVVRRLSLESGKTLQLYKGHNGPVTCLAFHEPDVLFTGSWDTTIKAWRISDKSLLSSTQAHSDFVKTLLVIPSLALMVSGSSDKIVRFWDLSSDFLQPIVQLGSISAHTRPVDALAFEPRDENSGILFTADTMGVIKIWELEREYGSISCCRATFKTDLQSHRTCVNDLWVGNGLVWSASSDGSVIIQPFPLSLSLSTGDRLKEYTIEHPNSVRAILPLSLTSLAEPYLISASGEVIRLYAYDFAAPEDSPELLGEIDAHWHDVTALGLWMKVVEKDGKKQGETWILSASLDATLRCWRLEDFLNPKDTKPHDLQVNIADIPTQLTLTEEEERELEELMGDD